MTYEQPQRIGDVLKLPGRTIERLHRKDKKVAASIKRKGADSERASLIGKITDCINVERDGKKYKKLTYAAIGFKLAHIPTKDLYYLIKVCEDSKNFSKKFWWLINPKNHL